MINGSVTMDKFDDMTDSQITKQLMQIRGLGQWTIEMFLLLALCRTDVVPSADFIFKKELQKMLNLSEIPKRGKINTLTETWRPWRSLAVWYIWQKANDSEKITQKAIKPSFPVCILQILGKDGFSYSSNTIYCSLITEYYFRLAIAAAVSSAP